MKHLPTYLYIMPQSKDSLIGAVLSREVKACQRGSKRGG